MLRNLRLTFPCVQYCVIQTDLCRMHEHLKGNVNKGSKNQCKNCEQSMLLNVGSTRSWSVKKDKNKIKVKNTTTAKTDQTIWF